MKTLKIIFLIFTCFGLIIGCSKDKALVNEPGGMNLKKATLAPVFIVEPNGFDDTENLKNAFANAITSGRASVVQLTDGEFYINFIEVREFHGLFKGAGKGKTILTNILDLDKAALTSQNLNVVLLRFVGGKVCISDMTVKHNMDYNSEINGLVGFSSITATYTAQNEYINAVVDNVEFIGKPDKTNQGLKAESGFNSSPPMGIPLADIDISVTNCSFEGFQWYGALIMEIREGKVIVGTKTNGNTFMNNPYAGLGIWHNISLKISVEDNSFTCQNAWCGLELHSSPYPGYLQQYQQTFASVANIEQNDFDVSGSWGAMIINDHRRNFFPEESPMLVQIKNNKVNTDEINTSGIRVVSLNGAVIRNNKFTGSGSNGVIAKAPAINSENGLILGNNFSNTNYSVATVILEIGTRNWTIVGGNLGETVLDEGENNIINGFNNQSSEVPPGQTIIDNLEEMRGPLHKLKVH